MKVHKILRKKYPEFVFKGWKTKFQNKDLEISYFFEIPPTFKFKSKILIEKIPTTFPEKKTFEKLLSRLGLIEMLNYWKLTCSPLIRIENFSLNPGELKFFKKLILKGMAQYFFENKINFLEKKFLTIKSQMTIKKEKPKRLKRSFFKADILIPLGGGKDSLVILEKMRKKKRKKIGVFVLNPTSVHLNLVRKAKIKKIIFVKRYLDPLLFRLNQKGFLNGHVPFSAFLTFLSLILAFIFRFKKVAFAWERASSYPNGKYLGRWINHQWSKSLEFEKEFQKYQNLYLLRGIEIFSPIRKTSEIEIAKEFSKLKRFHPYFLSCNKAFTLNSKEARWCKKCPKCFFTFLSLFPFLKEEEIIKIFGENFFERSNFWKILKALLGKEKYRPFECVGTPTEVKKLISLSIKKIKAEKKTLPLLFKKYESQKI